MAAVVAPCSFEAAKYAVDHWHYSHKMPSGKLIKYGVWQNERLIGAVVYGRGGNRNMLAPYGLAPTGGCELVRVALNGDQTEPASALVAATLRDLHATNPGLRLVVSYADTAQGHVGTLYQAGNWTYVGLMVPQSEVMIRGVRHHKRSVSSRYGMASVQMLREYVDPNARWVTTPPKHCYLMPLDRAMRRKLAPLALPYPRGSGLDSEPLAVLAGGPGATPGNRST